ncbi:hypothetical protein [Rhizobium leguminosarum]|uniref:hypothetical protein n=1 Tax=Rhizobium leguminosarum TaxID=384 RepID=UPI00103FD46B|nr:hypothetical protein [Rhizobium leguminosarum]TBZ47767.1 hypothetical protein E0H48_34690 [Rhizobium leguminosarum bv. viciae]TCA55147.1 hypothetical protein E0H41_29340 [Rhizobium leguminosarum bv. viciae]TCB15923.1 hypothetical protein E0J09_33850 [Rhizobium leguminosarum bv. viciae]
MPAVSALTGAQWNARLYSHYLSSDGPYGGVPMTFLDATVPELSAALGKGAPRDGVLASFLSGFGVSDVTRWLGRDDYPLGDAAQPSYFRYLVLTCVIAVNDIAGVDRGTHNFRRRLGQTLGMDELQTVNGVNRLWRGLADWSARQRRAGSPVREVVLPDYGTMNLIGYAVRMAFPSWRDRTQFTSILKSIPEAVRNSPGRLVTELSRPHRRLAIPKAIFDALDDFAALRKSGRTMLDGHRFWSLVKSIEAELSLATGEPPYRRLSVELRFGGYGQDEPEFRLGDGADGALAGDGSWLDTIGRLPQDHRSPLANALARGYSIFKRSAGFWVCDDAGVDANDICLVVAADGSPPRSWRSSVWESEVAPGWRISNRLDGSDVVRLLGINDQGIRELDRPKLAGGVPLKRGVYLGRPCFLPRVDQFGTANLKASRLVGSQGELAVGEDGEVTATEPLDGIWRISVTQGTNALDIPFALERNAAEPDAYPPPPRADKWQSEEELKIENRTPASYWAGQSPSGGCEPSETIIGLSEAILSRAGSGWRDGDLVGLLDSAYPKSSMIWDVIRSFQEAGWLDVYSSTSWRARFWRCRPPSIVRLPDGDAIIDGATGNAALDRLRDAAGRVGVGVAVHGGMSPETLPTVRLSGPGIDEVSSTLAWPITLPAGLPASRDQWIDDGRTPEGRIRKSIWSHELGLFLDYDRDPMPVTVECWTRERKDEADLYVVRGGADILRKTRSRVAAIIEGHRLNRVALFSRREDRVIRIRKSGHLPLSIARSMRFRSLRASGCSQDGPDREYSYFPDREVDVWLHDYLGSALEVDATSRTGIIGLEVERRHRGGRRLAWNAFPIGYGR